MAHSKDPEKQHQSNSELRPSTQYELVRSIPHDVEAFTQGLDFAEGFLYESTGLCQRSTLRKLDSGDGTILHKISVDAVCQKDCAGNDCFAEGLTVLNGRIFQLTEKSQKGFVYDLNSLRKLGEFKYSGQGWGLTDDREFLIMSNGSSQLQYLDPDTFVVVKTIDVKYNNNPLPDLNELEYVNGEIFANVFSGRYQHLIVRIDVKSEEVAGLIDLSNLSQRYTASGVLNGIAHDQRTDHLFITGKQWPRVFEIRVR